MFLSRYMIGWDRCKMQNTGDCLALHLLCNINMSQWFESCTKHATYIKFVFISYVYNGNCFILFNCQSSGNFTKTL